VVCAPAVCRTQDDDAGVPEIANKAAVSLRGAPAHGNAARDPCAPRNGSDDGLGHGGVAPARGDR
jgi:hypothetical protein